MTYWVEYKKDKWARENLMTDSIDEARAKAYAVIKNDHTNKAEIFNSRYAVKSEGTLYFLGGYYGWYLWVSHKGRVHHTYHVRPNGKLNGRVKD